MGARPKYQLSIDLNALNHLGINLYSNIPAVVSETVANSWDADAIQRAINERNVNVKIILEIAEEIGGKLSFDSIDQMRNAVKGANIYYWPIDQRKKTISAIMELYMQNVL